MLVDFALAVRGSASRLPVRVTPSSVAPPIRDAMPPSSRYWRRLAVAGLMKDCSIMVAPLADNEEVGGLTSTQLSLLKAHCNYAGLVQIAFGEVKIFGGAIGELVFLTSDAG